MCVEIVADTWIFFWTLPPCNVSGFALLKLPTQIPQVWQTIYTASKTNTKKSINKSLLWIMFWWQEMNVELLEQCLSISATWSQHGEFQELKSTHPKVAGIEKHLDYFGNAIKAQHRKIQREHKGRTGKFWPIGRLTNLPILNSHFSLFDLRVM